MLYRLVGEINWSVGSCHDYREMKIDQCFESKKPKLALEKAREIAEDYYKKHSWQTDFSMRLELYNGFDKKVWKADSIDEQPAKPYIPAQPARLAVKAHLKTRKLV